MTRKEMFETALRNKDRNYAAQFAENIHDQQLLFELLQNPFDSKVQLALCDNLTDPALLTKLAETRDDLWYSLAWRLSKHGSEADLPLFLTWFAQEDRLEWVLGPMSQLLNCEQIEIVERYGTEDTVRHYLSRLGISTYPQAESFALDAIRRLYRKGIGREQVRAQRGKTFRGHMDKTDTLCSRMVISTRHDDRPPLTIDSILEEEI